MRAIGIVCPTRERANRFEEFVQSAMSLASIPERVNIIGVLDIDEPQVGAYSNVAEDNAGVLLQRCKEKLSVPGLMDWGAKRAPCELIMAGSDDIICRTKGWDEALDSAMWPDGFGCVYFNNGDGRDRVEHFAVGKPWVDALGYFMRPEFKHFCADQWVGDMAKAVGRAKWLEHVTFEHMHAKYGKAKWDETYKAKRRENWSGADNLTMLEMRREWEQGRDAIARCL